MKTIFYPFIQKDTVISISLDIIALVFIYFVPVISHLINLPIYLIEPMRVMLIFALAHTSKTNAYILALTMPLFSFIISSHPEFPKMILITIELSLNVFLFYLFIKKINYLFSSVLLSIILSKIIYYMIKFSLIKLTIINTELISTPLYIQLITTLFFSLYLFKLYKNKIV
jgi:hypothetical protein